MTKLTDQASIERSSSVIGADGSATWKPFSRLALAAS
jgi:hypothetical protein